jgi:tetratricopeptide (TPR) repeat protein/cytoskeletal protein CcmA (bactofilin family)
MNKIEHGNIHPFKSFFCEGTFMKGVLKFNGALRFDGKFEGEIITDDTFIVGKTGEIKANIQTGSLFNSGEINGNISAFSKIAIHSEGKILGNIKTPMLTIEEGAQFNGNCEMDKGTKGREIITGQTPSEKKIHPLTSVKTNKKVIVTATGVFISILVAFTLYYFTNRLNIHDTIKKILKQENPMELMQTGLSLKEQGRKEDAIKTFRRLIQLNVNDPHIHLTTARAFIDMGLEDESISEYEKAIQYDPEKMETYHELFQLYTKKGMDDKAIVILKNITEKDDKNLNARLRLVALYEKNNMLENAYNEYKNIIVIAPDHEESLYNLGKISLSKGLEDESIEMFKRAIKINEKNIESHLKLADIYYRKGLEVEALDEYKKVEEIYPDHLEALNNKGFRAINSENLELATDEFNKVIKINEKNIRAHLGLAIVYGRIGSNEKAVLECKKVLEISPNHAPAINRLAWLYAKKVINIDEGIKLSKEAIKINPYSPEYLDTLSELYYIKGDFNSAIEIINKAINLKPEDIYYKKQLKKFTTAVKLQ